MDMNADEVNAIGKKSVNPVPFILLGILLISIGLTVLFGTMYYTKGRTEFYWPHFLSFIFALEFILIHINPPFCALFLFIISRNQNFYNSWWFTLHGFEKKLYKKLKVKKWKAGIATYDERLFDFTRHTPKQVLFTICQSEIVHELNVVLSFMPLVFTPKLGHWIIILIHCVIFSLVNIPFIIIQRYNRPRILKMMEILE